MNYRVRPFRLGPYIRTKPLSSAKTEKGRRPKPTPPDGPCPGPDIVEALVRGHPNDRRFVRRHFQRASHLEPDLSSPGGPDTLQGGNILIR